MLKQVRYEWLRTVRPIVMAFRESLRLQCVRKNLSARGEAAAQLALLTAVRPGSPVSWLSRLGGGGEALDCDCFLAHARAESSSTRNRL